MPSVFLVAALSLAFAIGTGQHFTTFGLYVVARGVRRGADRPLSRRATRLLTGLPAARGRRAPQGDDRRRGGAARAPARDARRESRRHLLRLRRESASSAPSSSARSHASRSTRSSSPMPGSTTRRLLEIVEAAHRRGVKVRVAPRTTELLIERGEYVPGQGVPLFELRPPIFAGAEWATKRTFDIVVGSLIVIVGLPIWIAARACDQALVVAARSSTPIAGSGSASGRSRCSSSARWWPAPPRSSRRSSARTRRSGALFKIRDDPRVTRIGRLLRRLLDRRGAERDQRAARRDVARRAAAAAGPRLRPARGVAPPPLPRAARDDRASGRSPAAPT